jgi:hypothetical protein
MHVPEKREWVVTSACEGLGTPTSIKCVLDGLKDEADKVRFVLSLYEQTGAVLFSRLLLGGWQLFFQTPLSKILLQQYFGKRVCGGTCPDDFLMA